MAELAGNRIAVGQLAVVIEVGETAGDQVHITGQLLKLFSLERHVQFAGLAIGNVIHHRVPILFAINAGQPFRQVVTDHPAHPRQLGIHRQLEHIAPKVLRHRLAHQRKGAQVGFARFVSDDRHGDFVIGVVIAMLIGIRSKRDQSATRPDLQGLHGGQYLRWHQRPKLIDVSRIDRCYPTVLVVKIG